MTIFEYHKMTEREQIDTVDQAGVLIGEREAAFCRIKLYQLEGFYVELYFHTHFNVLVNINCFTNTDCLDPYLQDVDIDSLLCA